MSPVMRQCFLTTFINYLQKQDTANDDSIVPEQRHVLKRKHQLLMGASTTNVMSQHASQLRELGLTTVLKPRKVPPIAGQGAAGKSNFLNSPVWSI